MLSGAVIVFSRELPPHGKVKDVPRASRVTFEQLQPSPPGWKSILNVTEVEVLTEF